MPDTSSWIDPLLALAGDARVPNRGPAIEVLTAILVGAGMRASAAESPGADPAVPLRVITFFETRW